MLEEPVYNKYGKLAVCNREKADGGELHMKRWKVTFGLFLLLFALATTVACAETKEAKMDWNDRTVIFAQPGETIHFTYDVPEDYVVTYE